MRRAVVAVALLAACGKPLRFFGDGGLPEAAIVDGPSMLDGPDIDADLTDAQICTTLSPLGAAFIPNGLTGGGPPITGGAIDDGTYRLIKVEQTSGPTNPYRETVRLAGAGTGAATYERVTLFTNDTGSWSTAATNLTMTPTCGPGPTTTRGYSYAPATGLLQIVDFFDPNNASQERVLTYHREF